MEDTVLSSTLTAIFNDLPSMMLRYSNMPESNKTLQVGDFEIYDSYVKIWVADVDKTNRPKWEVE